MLRSFRTTLARNVAVAALASALATPAVAQVRYDFEAFSSSVLDGEMISGSFSVFAPTFVTRSTGFGVGELSSCAAVSSLGDPAECSYQKFEFDKIYTAGPGYGIVSFGVITPTHPGRAIYYYFDTAAFSSPGTHASQILGADQEGQLTVTVVPEPATADSLLLGLGAIALLRRRARSH